MESQILRQSLNLPRFAWAIVWVGLDLQKIKVHSNPQSKCYSFRKTKLFPNETLNVIVGKKKYDRVSDKQDESSKSNFGRPKILYF